MEGQEGVILEMVEQEGRLADKNNAKEEEDTRDTFEDVQFVSKDDDREGNGDHRTGKDDTECIRDRHEADTGKAGDERNGSYDAWKNNVEVIMCLCLCNALPWD